MENSRLWYNLHRSLGTFGIYDIPRGHSPSPRTTFSISHTYHSCRLTGNGMLQGKNRIRNTPSPQESIRVHYFIDDRKFRVIYLYLNYSFTSEDMLMLLL